MMLRNTPTLMTVLIDIDSHTLANKRGLNVGSTWDDNEGKVGYLWYNGTIRLRQGRRREERYEETGFIQ
jgi:hypothetical protein